METISNISAHGQHILDSNDLCELLLNGKHINHTTVTIDEDIELYKRHQHDLLSNATIFDEIYENIDNDAFHDIKSSEWLIPDSHVNINVLEWLYNRCDTDQERERVVEEYLLFEERNLIMLLRLFIYIVDHVRKNKLFLGVGRGSSTCSYILYIIGVHRVDSLKYGLSISDYLK